MLDLDGTIIDSKDTIVNSAITVLESFGIKSLTKEEIRKSIGLPIEVVFGKFADGATLLSMAKAFREDLLLLGSSKTMLYPGAKCFLEKNMHEGNINVIVTNKPRELATAILRELLILDYFELVVGPGINLEPKPSPAMIQHVLNLFPNKSNAFMIGDRKEDIEAARLAGVTSVLMIHSDHDSTITTGSNPDYTSHGFKSLETLFKLGENDD